ncbi:hypothetical protein NFI96_006205 [Prochilodus magdalenae]|nr:hypothetical protein NFI96_006205 [Prochilodus magdalenae]
MQERTRRAWRKTLRLHRTAGRPYAREGALKQHLNTYHFEAEEQSHRQKKKVPAQLARRSSSPSGLRPLTLPSQLLLWGWRDGPVLLVRGGVYVLQVTRGMPGVAGAVWSRGLGGGMPRALRSAPPAPRRAVICSLCPRAGEKPFECPDCHERFARNSTLKCHMSACQNGSGAKKGRKKLLRNVQVCSEVFNSWEQFKDHLVIHTGEKPNHCTFCDQWFTAPRDLGAHLRDQHGFQGPRLQEEVVIADPAAVLAVDQE